MPFATISVLLKRAYIFWLKQGWSAHHLEPNPLFVWSKNEQITLLYYPTNAFRVSAHPLDKKSLAHRQAYAFISTHHHTICHTLNIHYRS